MCDGEKHLGFADDRQTIILLDHFRIYLFLKSSLLEITNLIKKKIIKWKILSTFLALLQELSFLERTVHQTNSKDVKNKNTIKTMN